MQLVLLLVLASVGTGQALSTGPYREASCRMWEHRDMQGGRRSVKNGESVSFAHNREAANTTWQEVDGNWNDAVSSAHVPARCELIVWEHMEGGGQSRTWRGGAKGLDVNYVGSAWNDRVSSARCNCEP